jgi:hypothetical protein
MLIKEISKENHNKMKLLFINTKVNNPIHRGNSLKEKQIMHKVDSLKDNKDNIHFNTKRLSPGILFIKR